MKDTLPGIRVLLALIALLGASLVGCDEEESQPPPAPRESVPVQFDIAVPSDTPSGAGVSAVGNHPALGDGQLPGLVLTRDVDGHFRAEVELPVGQSISYSLWLTQPSAEALDAEGLPLAPHTFTVEDRDGLVAESTVGRWSEPIDAAKPPVTFVVEVPANTPAGSEIWISGNQPELGNWNGAGVKLAKRSSDNRYVTRVTFATGTNLEFKVTRGGWGSVEKDEQGDELSNHTHKVTAPARVELKVGSWADLVPPKPKPDTLTGNIKYHDVSGGSVGLKDRQLIVWLPPGYDTETSRAYPVLYMHDGQNLMNTKTSFAGEWGVDETAQRLVEAGQMEPIIIVGVYNTGADRVLEYTHTPDPTRGGGKADDYGQLLVTVVKPLIDSTYRTKREAEFTGLAGSSLGGLVSMYLGITHPSTFTRLGVVSPSVWWANRDILTRINNLSGKPAMSRVWVDIGTLETSSSAGSEETVADTRALRDALTAKGWVLESDLKYLEAEGAGHNEAAWAARTEHILKFLYPPVP